MSNGTDRLGEAGQRQIINETAHEQIWRILTTVKWMAIFSILIVAFTMADAVLWDPLVAVGLGVLLAGAFTYLRLHRLASLGLLAARQRDGALFWLFLFLIIWCGAGYPWLDSIWPPYRAPWPLWIKLPLEVVTLAIRVACAWGIWGMWTELVDPNGPTAPRQAVNRDKTIKPWDPETHGGLDDAEPPARVVYLPTLVSKDNGNGSARLHEDRILLRAPGARPDGLYQYSAALADGRAFPSWEGGKTGAGARQYGYSEDEFDDWRAAAVKASLLQARPGQNQGYDLTDRGRHQFARIGERALNQAAFAPSPSQGEGRGEGR